MSSRVSLTIAPSRRRGPRLGVCLLVFLAGGAITYYLGQQSFSGSPSYTAQAGVSYRLPTPHIASGEPSGLPLPTQVEVEQRILADDNLRQALRAETSSAQWSPDNESVAALRKQIRIAVQGPSIGIRFSGHDANYVRRLVNQLAEQFAATERARLQQTASQQYQEAQQLAERAKHELNRLTVRLEEMQKKQADARQPASGASAPAGAPQRQSPQPQMIENPVWRELEQQLAVLQQRHAQLLIDRTPAHPEVQYVRAQIADVQKAQADTPRQIPDPSAREVAASPRGKQESGLQPPAGALGHVVPSPSSTDAATLDRELAALRAAVERSKEKVSRLAQAEQKAWERQQTIPPIQVHPAQHSQISGTAVTAWSPQWLMIALCVGLAVALPAGFLSTCQRRDRPVVSLAEIETLVPVPIVGVISPAKASHKNAACQVEMASD